MKQTFNIPPLSKEVICQKLKCIDRVLSNHEFNDDVLENLDSSNDSFAEPDLCKSKLIDILMEARDCLLTLLEALGESEVIEEFSHESLTYTYQIKATRNGIGQST